MSQLKPSDVFWIVDGFAGDGPQRFNKPGDALFFPLAQVEADVLAQEGGPQFGIEL